MALKHNWIDQLTSGHISVAVPEFRMERGSQTFECGTGFVSWERESGVRVRAITRPANESGERAGEAPSYRVGTLIPVEAFDQAVGITEDGWKFLANPTFFPDRVRYNPSPYSFWNFQADGFNIAREPAESVTPWISALLVTPPLWHCWPRKTKLETTNDVWGGDTQISADSLWVKLPFGAMAAKRLDTHHVELQIDRSEQNESPSHTAIDLLEAVRVSFAIALGGMVAIVGSEVREGSGEERRANVVPREFDRNPYLCPFNNERCFQESIETFLTKAIPHFLKPDSLTILPHLEACWNAINGTIDTRVLVTAAAVEALVKDFVKSGRFSGKPDIEDVELLEQLLTQQPGFTNGFSNRVLNAVKGWNARPVDVLTHWQKRKCLGVSESITKDFSNLRHPTMHGISAQAKGIHEERQTYLTSLLNIEGLITRILLQKTGFQGWFTPWDGPHPEFQTMDVSKQAIQFPLTVDEDLFPAREQDT